MALIHTEKSRKYSIANFVDSASRYVDLEFVCATGNCYFGGNKTPREVRRL